MWQYGAMYLECPPCGSGITVRPSLPIDAAAPSPALGATVTQLSLSGQIEPDEVSTEIESPGLIGQLGLDELEGEL